MIDLSRIWIAAVAIVTSIIVSAGAVALAQQANTPSGLDVPRFVSLKFDHINVRRGPGMDHEIDWVFRRKGMPVQVIAESDHWRRIRDVEGSTGWIHRTMLDSQRTILILEEMRPLREEPSRESDPVAFAEPGVVAELLRCQPDWCQVRSDKIQGWIRTEFVFGLTDDDLTTAPSGAQG